MTGWIINQGPGANAPPPPVLPPPQPQPGSSFSMAQSAAPAPAPDQGSIADYIRQGAIQRGIDPNLALHVPATEGGTGQFKLGDNGSSGGPFQLHLDDPSRPGAGSSMGDAFYKSTGLNPLDPKNERATIDYALDYAKSHGGTFDPNIWHGLRQGGGGSSQWQITGAGNWNVDPAAVTSAQNQPDTSVVWMAPDDYKQMVAHPENEPVSPSQPLTRALAAGEKINDLPSLDVKRSGNQYMVVDQDGLKRAQAAIDAGVQLIPVAIRGASGGATQIVGMGGQVKPYDFKPVAAASKPEKPASLLEQFGTGVRTAIGGATQAAVHMMPDGLTDSIDRLNNFLVDEGVPLARVPAGGVDEMEREREQKLVQERGPDPTFAETAGEIAATLPLSRLIPGAGSNALARIGGAAAAGALGSLAEPVTSQEPFWQAKGEQAAEGAALGGGLGVAGEGLARVVAPYIQPAAQRLMDLGVRLTPGMMQGGAIKGAENRLSSVVPTISGAVRRAIHDFNIAAYNKVLEPLGIKYTGSEVGYDGFAKVEKEVSGAYNRLLPNLTFKVDRDFLNDIHNLRTMTSYLPQDDARRFSAIFNNEFMQRLGPRGTMDGQTLKLVESGLTRQAGVLRRSQEPRERELGKAVGEINAALRSALERSNPDQARELRKINRSWAALQRVSDAVSSRSTSLGIFSPSDLLNAARKSAGKKVFARGDALMQDLGRDAQEIIPNTYPDSGTAGRMLTGELVAGGGAAIFSHPGVLATVLAANAAYTRPGVAGLRFLAGSGLPQVRNALARTVRQGANALAPGSSALAPNPAMTSQPSSPPMARPPQP